MNDRRDCFAGSQYLYFNIFHHATFGHKMHHRLTIDILKSQGSPADFVNHLKTH